MPFITENKVSFKWRWRVTFLRKWLLLKDSTINFRRLLFQRTSFRHRILNSAKLSVSTGYTPAIFLWFQDLRKTLMHQEQPFQPSPHQHCWERGAEAWPPALWASWAPSLSKHHGKEATALSFFFLGHAFITCVPNLGSTCQQAESRSLEGKAVNLWLLWTSGRSFCDSLYCTSMVD